MPYVWNFSCNHQSSEERCTQMSGRVCSQFLISQSPPIRKCVQGVNMHFSRVTRGSSPSREMSGWTDILNSMGVCVIISWQNGLHIVALAFMASHRSTHGSFATSSRTPVISPQTMYPSLKFYTYHTSFFRLGHLLLLVGNYMERSDQIMQLCSSTCV
jgi:hypothetical protein